MLFVIARVIKKSVCCPTTDARGLLPQSLVQRHTSHGIRGEAKHSNFQLSVDDITNTFHREAARLFVSLFFPRLFRTVYQLVSIPSFLRYDACLALTSLRVYVRGTSSSFVDCEFMLVVLLNPGVCLLAAASAAARSRNNSFAHGTHSLFGHSCTHTVGSGRGLRSFRVVLAPILFSRGQGRGTFSLRHQQRQEQQRQR